PNTGQDALAVNPNTPVGPTTGSNTVVAGSIGQNRGGSTGTPMAGRYIPPVEAPSTPRRWLLMSLLALVVMGVGLLAAYFGGLFSPAAGPVSPGQPPIPPTPAR